MESHFPKRALKIVIWVFFFGGGGGVKIKIWVFLGFSKKISDEHTYHFYIKSVLRLFYVEIDVFVTKLDLSSVNICWYYQII